MEDQRNNNQINGQKSVIDSQRFDSVLPARIRPEERRSWFLWFQRTLWCRLAAAVSGRKVRESYPVRIGD
jgi:hypothetical protein